MSLRFDKRLVELGANDAVPTAQAKSRISDSYRSTAKSDRPTDAEVILQQRVEKCPQLVLSATENDPLADTAKFLDGQTADFAPHGDQPLIMMEPSASAINPLEMMPIFGMSEPRKIDFRCTLKAVMLLENNRRDASRNAYGLTGPRLALLQKRLNELLIAETGVSEAALKWMLVDMPFEDEVPQQPLDFEDDEIAERQPIFDSIDVSRDAVSGLAPLANPDGHTAPICYAMLMNASRRLQDNGAEAEASRLLELAENLANNYLMAHSYALEAVGAEIARAISTAELRNASAADVETKAEKLKACEVLAVQL